VLGALRGGEHEQRGTGGPGQRARQVEAATTLARGVGRQERDRPGRGQQRQRQVDEEHAAPAERLGEHPAEQRAEAEPTGARRRPDAERAVPARALRERRVDEGQRRGEQGGRADALDDPSADQRLRRGGEAAERRSRGEQDDAGEEQAAPAQQVAQPAGEQQQAAEGDRIAADHPLLRVRREPEVADQVGQRDVDDREVEGRDQR
jgi:hypothetical protein